MKKDQGYIYILSNPAFKDGLFKIGMTTRSADDRAWEIYTGATGVPTPFKVEYTFPVSRCALAEKQVHDELCDYRFSEQREFFMVSKKIARRCIASIGSNINEEFGEPTPPKIETGDWTILSENKGGDEEPVKVLEHRPVIVVKSHTRQRTSPNTTSDAGQTYEAINEASKAPSIDVEPQNEFKSYEKNMDDCEGKTTSPLDNVIHEEKDDYHSEPYISKAHVPRRRKFNWFLFFAFSMVTVIPLSGGLLFSLMGQPSILLVCIPLFCFGIFLMHICGGIFTD